MGDVLHYLDVPPLIVFSLMAVLLVRLHRDENGNGRLWALGLGLIAFEGFARMVFLAHTPLWVHRSAHIFALNSYFLAGVVFLQSVSGRFTQRIRPIPYIVGCSVPFVALFSAYGADVSSRTVYVAIAAIGLLGSMAFSLAAKRPQRRLLVHAAMWLPVLASAWLGDPRQAVYSALFAVYALTAFAFFRGVPGALSGRGVVVAGFGALSLCFLIHPWLSRHELAWVPMLNEVWDLQKFVVMFGLLILSLAEQGRKAEYEALHDPLTGLANRRLFDDRLEQALSKASRDGSRVLLFTMDLDHFKKVNDTLGHSAGDTLLCAVATRLRSVTRRSDTLARIGGDEFQLIASGFPSIFCETSKEEIELLERHGRQLAEKLRSAIAVPVKLSASGETLTPSVSIGFSIYPLNATSPIEMQREADEAMYQNKRKRSDPLETPLHEATA